MKEEEAGSRFALVHFGANPHCGKNRRRRRRRRRVPDLPRCTLGQTHIAGRAGGGGGGGILDCPGALWGQTHIAGIARVGGGGEGGGGGVSK